jgi:hypothetical protein
MEKDYLTLKRASISHRSGKERDEAESLTLH